MKFIHLLDRPHLRFRKEPTIYRRFGSYKRAALTIIAQHPRDKWTFSFHIHDYPIWLMRLLLVRGCCDVHALHYALDSNRINLSKFLITCGKYDKSRTIFPDQRTEPWEFLLRYGFPVPDNYFPLEYAAQENLIELCRILIGAGCPINRTEWCGEGGGWTPLYTAVHFKLNHEIVDLLLEGGADPTIGKSIVPKLLEYDTPEAHALIKKWNLV